MIDIFTMLMLLALVGGGFLIFRRFLNRHNMMNPPMEMPWQQEYGPKDEYGRRVQPYSGYDGPHYDPDYEGTRYGRSSYVPGYDPRGYNRSMYGPSYAGYPPQQGISPWAAGGLGAVGGGLLGYELGRMAGEHDQQTPEGESMNAEQAAMPDAGNSAPADAPGIFDAGSLFDFSGGDFGGGEF